MLEYFGAFKVDNAEKNDWLAKAQELRDKKSDIVQNIEYSYY